MTNANTHSESHVHTHRAPEGSVISESKLSEDGTSIVIVYEKVNKLPTTLEELNSGGWYEQVIYDSNCLTHEVCPAEKHTAMPPGAYEYDSKEMAEAFIALRQLVRFRDAWNKSEEGLFSIRVHAIKSSHDSTIICTNALSQVSNPRDVLAFHSPELRDKFLEQFKDLIIKALPLI